MQARTTSLVIASAICAAFSWGAAPRFAYADEPDLAAEALVSKDDAQTDADAGLMMPEAEASLAQDDVLAPAQEEGADTLETDEGTPDDTGSSPQQGPSIVDGHYIQADGTILEGSGWHLVEEGWVLSADASGTLRRGWAKVGGAWYWLDPDTYVMATGWLKVNGTHYYLKPSGAMATGWQKLDGSWYYFASSGAMVTGWAKVGGTWYWLDPQTGVMATGWQRVGDAWYYLKPSGAMATGWQHLNGTWYYLNPSGAVATGWKKLGGTWYWLDKQSGAMATGWQDVNGATYWFSTSGAMATGWKKVGGSWRLFAASGALRTGWVKTGGSWYWLDPQNHGAMPYGWFQAAGVWYWQGDDGCAQDEYRIINGVGWAFDKDCSWGHVDVSAVDDGTRSIKQSVTIAQCKKVPSPGYGLCAAWVSDVFYASGQKYLNLNADEMYDLYCTSSDLAELKPGMIVAVDSHPHTFMGSIYGHVGIYVGNGRVIENVGTIRTSDLSSWLWWYGATHTPKWGWYDNKVLVDPPAEPEPEPQPTEGTDDETQGLDDQPVEAKEAA